MADIFLIETREKINEAKTDRVLQMRAQDPTFLDYEQISRQQAQALATLCKEGIIR